MHMYILVNIGKICFIKVIRAVCYFFYLFIYLFYLVIYSILKHNRFSLQYCIKFNYNDSKMYHTTEFFKIKIF